MNSESTIIEYYDIFFQVLSYLLIPIISAFVGWGTNVLALKMTFYPLDFKGIPPLLGWQGIIPNKSKIMAEKSVDLIVGKLVNMRDQFNKLDAKIVAQEMGPSLERLSRKVTKEILASKFPMVWKLMPKKRKEIIHARVRKELPKVVSLVMNDVQEHLDELFDLKAMVVNQLLLDKGLLNEIFLKVGYKEFRFVEQSGLLFGFLFGIIQMILWFFFPYWFVLPLAGLMVGYLTNYIALRLIFEPEEAIRIGPWTWIGLFIKRQKEVAAEYAHIVAEKIITSEKIFDALVDGPKSEKLQEVIDRHIYRLVDAVAGDQKDLVVLITGPDKFQTLKNIAAFSFYEDLPIIIRDVFDYTEEALEIECTLRDKMAALPSNEFAGFLRPVFQEDEWKLIAVGAFLGFIAGIMQWLFMF